MTCFFASITCLITRTIGLDDGRVSQGFPRTGQSLRSDEDSKLMRDSIYENDILVYLIMALTLASVISRLVPTYEDFNGAEYA